MSESYPSSHEMAGEVASREVEMLDAAKTIEELLSWIIECGPGADPTHLSLKRARLIGLLGSLGFIGEDAISEFYDFRAALMQRASDPVPTIEVPNTDWFADRIALISIEEYPDGVYFSRPDLLDVARFAHTDWSKVGSRDPKIPVAEYTRRMAHVMADPIAYHLNIPESREGTIEVSPDLFVQNGRHRTLVARCLGPVLVAQSEMAGWVNVIAE